MGFLALPSRCIAEAAPLHAAVEILPSAIMHRLHAVAVRPGPRAVAVPGVCTPLHALGGFGSVSTYPFLRLPLLLMALIFPSHAVAFWARCHAPIQFLLRVFFGLL